jgi:hypothetical protein
LNPISRLQTACAIGVLVAVLAAMPVVARSARTLPAAHAVKQAQPTKGSSCADPVTETFTGASLDPRRYGFKPNSNVYRHDFRQVLLQWEVFRPFGEPLAPENTPLLLFWQPRSFRDRMLRSCWARGVDATGNPWMMRSPIANLTASSGPPNPEASAGIRYFRSGDPGTVTVAVAHVAASDGQSCQNPYVVAGVGLSYKGDKHYISVSEKVMHGGSQEDIFTWAPKRGTIICSFNIIHYDGGTQTIQGPAGGSYTQHVPYQNDPLYPNTGIADAPLAVWVSAARH